MLAPFLQNFERFAVAMKFKFLHPKLKIKLAACDTNKILGKNLRFIVNIRSSSVSRHSW